MRENINLDAFLRFMERHGVGQKVLSREEKRFQFLIQILASSKPENAGDRRHRREPHVIGKANPLPQRTQRAQRNRA
jgi:hypothetical protein